MGAGRPKGKNKFQISLSLTQQQREWVQNQPNSSDLVGGLIDSLISVDDLTPEYIKFMQQQIKSDTIDNKLSSLKEEKRMFLFRGLNRMHFKGSWIEDDERQHTRYYAVENFNNPEPIDSEGQILKRKLDLMTAAIKQLQMESEKIKTEMSRPTEQQMPTSNSSN